MSVMPARMTKARVMIILRIRGQRVMLDRDLPVKPRREIGFHVKEARAPYGVKRM